LHCPHPKRSNDSPIASGKSGFSLFAVPWFLIQHQKQDEVQINEPFRQTIQTGFVFREGLEGGKIMSEPVLEPQMHVCRIGDVLDADMDGEVVMMNIEQGRYFGLNQTGTRIWALLAEAVVISDLCDQLTAEFSVDPKQCEQEVVAFLENLLTRGLLQVVTDGS
jgi:hypothetical protein